MTVQLFIPSSLSSKLQGIIIYVNLREKEQLVFILDTNWILIFLCKVWKPLYVSYVQVFMKEFLSIMLFSPKPHPLQNSFGEVLNYFKCYQNINSVLLD